MDLELTPDLLDLHETAHAVLARHAPLGLSRATLEGGADVGPLWAQLAELGWYGVGLDDDDPFGVVGVGLLAQEIGAHAAPTVFVDAAVVARVAATIRPAWRERIEAGHYSVALALLEPQRGWDPDAVTTAARRDGDGARISGTKIGVPHAGRVDRIAVVARADDGLVVALVDPAAEGVAVEASDALDAATAPARVVLDGAAVTADDLLDGPDLADALRRALAVGTVATAAEGLGAAGAALDLATQYAHDREQFGTPIGTFQAVKHILAEQHARRETAWASVFYAAAALDERLPSAVLDVSVAKAHASAATRAIAEGALQVLGGIGVTWEHDFHLLFRRVLDREQRFGAAAEHERRLEQGLLAPEPARSTATIRRQHDGLAV